MGGGLLSVKIAPSVKAVEIFLMFLSLWFHISFFKNIKMEVYHPQWKNY